MTRNLFQVLRENIMRGKMMLGASLRRAVEATGVTFSAAKAKVEASITPETRAKIGAAMVKLNDFGQSASSE